MLSYSEPKKLNSAANADLHKALTEKESAFFDFPLPKELIAQAPVDNRTGSRLLIVDPESGQLMDESFINITKYLTENDLLVLNDTKVINARFFGARQTGGKVEFLYLNEKDADLHEVLVKPARKVQVGDTIDLQVGARAEIICDLGEGRRLIKFMPPVFDPEKLTHQTADTDEVVKISSYLEKYGITPTPPYITGPVDDPNRYQTVYAKKMGSAAAPTAGLHFDEGLLSEIKKKGVEIAYVTLTVGLGTFKPIDTELIEDFSIHEEVYEISEQNANILNSAMHSGKRIVCVGTTSLRTLESAHIDGSIRSGRFATSLFIKPGYKFMVAKALITNFHFPKTTLFVLVCACAGSKLMKDAYKHAVEKRYRALSFGDAMFITSLSDNNNSLKSV